MAQSLYLSDQVHQSSKAALSGMRGHQGCCRSRLPQLRRLFAWTTAIAILTLTEYTI